MRNIFALLLTIATIVLSIYLFFWWGIVEPIMTIAQAIDTDTVTASLIGWELIKFIFKEVVAVIVFFVGMSIAGAVAD